MMTFESYYAPGCSQVVLFAYRMKLNILRRKGVINIYSTKEVTLSFQLSNLHNGIKKTLDKIFIA